MHEWWIFWGGLLGVAAWSWSRGLRSRMHQRAMAHAQQSQAADRVVSQMQKPPARPAGERIGRFRLRPIWSAIELNYEGYLVRLPFAGVDQRPMSQGNVRAVWVGHVNGRETPLLVRTSMGVFYGSTEMLDS